MGAQEAILKFSGSGPAAEAWALPRYLPSVIMIDFEEIEDYILGMNNNSIHNSFHTAQPAPGEAAGLRTPAASHRPLPTLGYFRWVTFKLFVHYSLFFVHYSLLFVHYANEAIQEICHGILGRLLGLLVASWGFWRRSWGLLRAFWGVLGVS